MMLLINKEGGYSLNAFLHGSHESQKLSFLLVPFLLCFLALYSEESQLVTQICKTECWGLGFQ